MSVSEVEIPTMIQSLKSTLNVAVLFRSLFLLFRCNVSENLNSPTFKARNACENVLTNM